MSSRIRIFLILLTTAGVLGAATDAPPAFGAVGAASALLASAPAGISPSVVAVDPATHTLYVANGNNADGPTPGGTTLSVIDARRCNARDASHCGGPWPTLTVGNNPSRVAVDIATDTVYVSDNADNTVSVIDGATCNALTTAGCGQTPATVPVGSSPFGLFADDANHTLYVSNYGDGTVSMIDTATCDATNLIGCPSAPPATVTVGGNPGDVDVNPDTHTVYVANLTGLSVFDADTCNATHTAGCSAVGQAPVPACNSNGCGPYSAKVDAVNDTIYESDGTTTVFVFDGRTCNAGDLAGCAGDTPGEVTPFPEPGFEVDVWVAVDAALHTVYVTYQKDDALILIDTNACNGSHLAACASVRPQEIHTATDPESVALDDATQTLYTANQLSDDVSVIDPARCDARTSSGCRARAPEVPINSSGLAADPAVRTTYATSSEHTVSLIDTVTCNALETAGCTHTPPTTAVGNDPDAVAVDRATHTVYVAGADSQTGGTITVLDDRGCNAHTQAGCSKTSTMNVPDGRPVALAVNRRTDTIYAATITSSGGPNLISVFNGATCNATDHRGCGQTPATVPTGDDGGGNSTESVAVNPATNTVYATSDTLVGPFFGQTVYVLDGTTCDATDGTGCGTDPATISVGSDPVFGDENPLGIAVDVATDTVYTADLRNGEGPGTVSIINGATCNSTTTSGCGQTPATAPSGFGTNGIAVDQATNQVYTTNIEDTSITTIDGAMCNAARITGCGLTRTRPVTGDYPGPIVIDPAVDTAYVADKVGVSVVPLIR